MSEEPARRSHGALPREDGRRPREDGPRPREDAAPLDATATPLDATAVSGVTAPGNPAVSPPALAEPAGLPQFEVLALLRRQLAEADEPWELSVAEIAALPRAGDAKPPELDEVPWWLSEEFTGTDAELGAAFLRNLPSDIRAEYEAGPWTGAGEAWGAGFVHHDEVAGPRGHGFAAGGEHDILAPGPELAAAAAAAAARPRELGESELIGVLCGWQRLASWAQAGQAECLNELMRRRKDQSVALKRPSLAAHVDDEVAAALALTGQAAGRLLGVAGALGRLPVVAGALAAGEVDWVKAGLFADYLAGIPDADAAGIAAAVLRGAGRKTSGQLRAALVRAVLAYDPQSAQRRREAAGKDASVQVWQEPSGNAGLAGRELAAADAVEASARLTACARWLREHGAVGSVDELRAAAFIALLTDQPLESLLPPAAAGDSAPDDSAPDDGAAGDGAPDDGAAGDGAPDDGAAGDGAPDDSAAGDSAPDDSAAGEANAPAASAGGTAGDARTADSAGVAGGPRLTGSINLTMPMSAWLGQSGSPGELSGYGPADAATCAELAGRAGLSARWCLTLTDAAGRAVAHACAGHAPPPGPGAIRWARGLRDKLEVLETGTCSHARRAAGYCPPRSLRNLVCIRQRTCSFPGCRRPAVRCDLDHTVPYDAGGATCECNLAPLCRRHHQGKQAPGWQLNQDQPGIMTWRLPSGREYATCPEPYPI
jgi:hypothetical protein